MHKNVNLISHTRTINSHLFFACAHKWSELSRAILLIPIIYVGLSLITKAFLRIDISKKAAHTVCRTISFGVGAGVGSAVFVCTVGAVCKDVCGNQVRSFAVVSSSYWRV